MKAIVCGKGGCGKSVLTALLAKEMNTRGYRVLVVDNDESNFGLHTYLGLDLPEEFKDHFGGRDNLFDSIEEMDGFRIDNLPEEFISSKNGYSLLTVGKIREYGEGCACPLNVLSSKFIQNIDLEEDEFLVVDSEAGVEHFGRGVEKGCDVILMVVDPTRESLGLAEQVMEFGKSLEKKVFFVLNKVDEEKRAFLLEHLPEDKVITSIPEDDRIFDAGMRGKELDVEVEGPGAIADRLIESY